MKKDEIQQRTEDIQRLQDFEGSLRTVSRKVG